MASWEAKTANHDEDIRLVESARKGDRVAFERLYRRHRDRIYGLVWRLCGGDAALAEDLLQEALSGPGRSWTVSGAIAGLEPGYTDCQPTWR